LQKNIESAVEHCTVWWKQGGGLARFWFTYQSEPYWQLSFKPHWHNLLVEGL